MALRNSEKTFTERLSFLGTVSGIAGAPNFQCADLAGHDADFFEGYSVYVVWNVLGTGAAPQGQQLVCTGYVPATGGFVMPAAFAPVMAVGNKVLLLHPSLATSWPIIQARVSVNEAPQVAQPAIEVARLEIHNQRPDAAVIAPAEYAGTTISIERYRYGVDAGWVNILAGTPMLENVGYANYSYAFPAVSWQNGDLIRYSIWGCVVTIPAGAVGADIYVPPQAKFGVVGGLPALIALATTTGANVATILALVSAELTLDESNGVLTATGPGTEDNVYINAGPAGSFKPRVVKIDLDLMVGGDTTVIRYYERLTPGVAWWLMDYESYAGVDGGLLNGVKAIYVEMQPNRYGVRVTLEQTVGAVKNYQWERLSEE